MQTEMVLYTTCEACEMVLAEDLALGEGSHILETRPFHCLYSCSTAYVPTSTKEVKKVQKYH